MKKDTVIMSDNLFSEKIK